MKTTTERTKSVSTFGLTSDVQYLIQNLGLLLGAGVDVVGALDSIQEGIRNPRMKRIVSTMRHEIAEGMPLSKAFERTGLFPARVATLIRIGEESGQLVEHFKMIGLQEEKQRALSTKVQSALMYPVFVLGVTLIVGIGVAWFILPNLARVFAQMKLTLPLITRAILSFGSFLSEYGIIAVPLFVLSIGALFYFIFVYTKTKWIGETLLFSIPGVRILIQEVELARLGFILGGLLKSGVPILDALESLEGATQMTFYKRLYAHLHIRINHGDSFEQSLKSYSNTQELIPTPIQQLIVTASKSGTMATILMKVGTIFEEKSDTSTRNLSIILEPVLLFVVWIAVVGVALGVILPIYNLIGGISHQ